MANERDERKLTAIFAADVVGYSRLIEADESGTLSALTAHRAEALDPKITELRGRIVSTAGDSVLAEFASVVDAVQCAAEIQRAMADRNEGVSADKRIEFRIGVNLGDIIVVGDDIHGDGVNVAARLEALADPGGIFISGAAFSQVENKLELGYEDLGERKVKNIAKPIQVYRVLLATEAAGTLITAKLPRQTPTRWVVAAAAVLIIVIGSGVIWNFAIRDVLPSVEAASLERMAFPLPDRPSLAVLPFDNLTGDADQDYFVDGFVDDLITDLSKISTIFVVSRSSSFTYKGKPVKIKQVAEELGVRYVLEGSIRRAGGTIRVNAQLIDALSGNHVWAEKFDGDAADIFALQDEINDKIVAGLSVTVSAEQRKEARRRETGNPEAWDAYRQGLKHIDRFTAVDNGLANAFFKKALELDPNYAPAIGLLAATYMEAGQRPDPDWWREVGAETPEEAFAAFEPLLAKALERPTDFAYRLDARWATFRGQHERALTQALRAVDLAPYHAGALIEVAMALIWAGRPEEGLRRANEARRLNPKGKGNEAVRGLALFSLERYEEAAAELKTARSLSPVGPALVMLMATYAHLDRQEEMQALRDEFFELSEKRFGRLPTISGTLRFFPWAKPEDQDRFTGALRKAGVPE
ncbi:MAG: guanylyl cyclase [Proteobacteria bacterium]|nr:guanylyl cyclase [Pseudomonadota bacterium]